MPKDGAKWHTNSWTGIPRTVLTINNFSKSGNTDCLSHRNTCFICIRFLPNGTSWPTIKVLLNDSIKIFSPVYVFFCYMAFHTLPPSRGFDHWTQVITLIIIIETSIWLIHGPCDFVCISTKVLIKRLVSERRKYDNTLQAYIYWSIAQRDTLFYIIYS